MGRWAGSKGGYWRCPQPPCSCHSGTERQYDVQRPSRIDSVAFQVDLIVHRELCRHGWDGVQRISRLTAVIVVAARRSLLTTLAREHHVREF